MVSENKCGIIKKTCEEFDIWRCDKYSSDEGKPLTRCEYSQTENKCKEFTCEQLSKNECSKFDVNEDNKVCAPSGNNCAIHSCEDFDSTICETIEFSNPAYKCMNTDEGCKFKSIYEYNNLEDGEVCEEFIPVNKAYKCIYNSYYKSCEIKAKECGELSKDECDLFNFKDNLDRTDGKKCVYSDDDGKCVLNSTSNSKNVEFCAYIFLILFLLF